MGKTKLWKRIALALLRAHREEQDDWNDLHARYYCPGCGKPWSFARQVDKCMASHPEKKPDSFLATFGAREAERFARSGVRPNQSCSVFYDPYAPGARRMYGPSGQAFPYEGPLDTRYNPLLDDPTDYGDEP